MRLLLVCALVFFARAQESPEEPPQIPPPLNELPEIDPSRSIAVAINDIIHPWYGCRLVKTRNILGYQTGTYGQKPVPVYENTCTGFCLSRIAKPNTCQPTYVYISVQSSPYFYGYGRSVRQVSSCNCKPKQCVVTGVNGAVRYYNHGATVIDACERKCTCDYGTLINCCRQRKEFRRGMTAAERQRFIDTYLFASTDPAYKPTFDPLVLSHGTLFGSGIHNNARFFPWHRYYILRLENLLQQIDCRVTVPYWDWALEATSPMTSSIWGSGSDDLGGDGTGPGGCVQTGPFASPGWTTATGGCLTRNFNLMATTATVAQIQAIIAANPLAAQYDNFRNSVEHGPGLHDSVHCIISGTMCSVQAATAPEFFLHHCKIDKIWADWQAADPTHVLAYGPASAAAPMPGTSTTPADMLDLNDQRYEGSTPGVRICYINPPNWIWWEVAVEVVGIEKLVKLPRVFTTPADETWWKLMNWTEEQIRAQHAVEDAENDPKTHDIVTQADAKGNCTLMAETGIFFPDDTLNKLGRSLTEQGTQEGSEC